jgi:hypothetical protein
MHLGKDYLRAFAFICGSLLRIRPKGNAALLRFGYQTGLEARQTAEKVLKNWLSRNPLECSFKVGISPLRKPEAEGERRISPPTTPPTRAMRTL